MVGDCYNRPVGSVGRLLALACGLAVTAGGAAGCGQEAARVAQIRPWSGELPYLAPSATPRRAGARARRAVARGPRTSTLSATPPSPATTSAPADAPAPSGPASDAQVRAELRQAFKGSGADVVDRATLTGADLADPPVGAPAKVGAIINAGNQVARKPYVYGGGHGGGPEGLFTDTAYDCSGSVSYALAAAGLVDSPMDSSSLARYGRAGRGRWVTIYANAGHAWMVVAGLRFDTVGRASHGSRWQSATRSTAGFTVRHPPGL